MLLNNFVCATKHAERHAVMKAGMYKCEIIEKAFGAKSDLKRHTVQVH